ncbi:MAG: hypothetical protein OXN25_12635 [Candidatus Poribacteria bacterium]|nr:hypothetical protein [Candidatus Poribacteria bacterium]
MLDILDIPELGKVEIVEVYEYYDQPVLYSCKNASGHFYLVVAAAEDAQFLTWLCVAVSIERLNLIRSGKIDLHDAFADSENPYTIQVRVPYAEHASVQKDFIQSNQIPEEMLPLSGECLDIETEILPALSDAEEMAKSRRQEILNLNLNLAAGSKTQAPIVFISNIFGKLQSVINTIGMICFNASQVTEGIRNSVQMSLLQVSPGSFNIHLASPEITQLDLFDNSDCGEAIEKFFELLNAKNNPEKLKKLLGQLKLRVTKDYTNFLKSLSESVIDTKFTWRSPNPERGGTAYLSNSQMEAVIEILEKFQEEAPSRLIITGTLIAASLRTNRFEIKTVEKTYTGDIADEVLETADNITLNLKYTAEIQEVTERSEATDELTKPKYLLLSLSR